MKRRGAVLLVTVFTISSIWGLIQLSQSPTDSTSAPVQAANTPGGGSGHASSASSRHNASPDLSMLDSQAFLDPIPVGQKAPDFTLQDATTGKPFKLSDFRGKKNVVLVFYQGSFCPVCGHQLENLQRHTADFQKQDAIVAAISADAVPAARQTVGEHGLSLHVLADPDHKVIKQFGVSNIGKRGIAWPASFIIDKKGVVRLSVADEKGKRLHSNDLLPALGALTGKPVPKLSYED